MTDDTDTDTTTEELFRNDPTNTFDAHLFESDDVRAAGGDTNGTKADSPVASLCSRTTSYGPFRTVTESEVRDGDLDGHDGDLCGTCAESAESRYDERMADGTPPTDPTDCTVEELREVLDDPDLDTADLRALAQAEREGDNRTTALNAIEQALDEGDA